MSVYIRPLLQIPALRPFLVLSTRGRLLFACLPEQRRDSERTSPFLRHCIKVWRCWLLLLLSYSSNQVINRHRQQTRADAPRHRHQQSGRVPSPPQRRRDRQSLAPKAEFDARHKPTASHQDGQSHPTTASPATLTVAECDSRSMFPACNRQKHSPGQTQRGPETSTRQSFTVSGAQASG
jgi:hypothetical protein